MLRKNYTAGQSFTKKQKELRGLVYLHYFPKKNKASERPIHKTV